MNDSPGRSVPDDRLGYSQDAPVDAVQRTGVCPDAVRVMRVVSPSLDASTVSRPGLSFAPGTALTTSTETSGEPWSFLTRPLSAPVPALPALPAFS